MNCFIRSVQFIEIMMMLITAHMNEKKNEFILIMIQRNAFVRWCVSFDNFFNTI